MNVREMIKWLSGLDQDMHVLVLEQVSAGTRIGAEGYDEDILNTSEVPLEPRKNTSGLILVVRA